MMLPLYRIKLTKTQAAKEVNLDIVRSGVYDAITVYPKGAYYRVVDGAKRVLALRKYRASHACVHLVPPPPLNKCPLCPTLTPNKFCKKHKDTPTWTTGNGEVIPIPLMENSHLTNTLVFLQKQAKTRAALTGVDESNWQELTPPIYKALLDEAIKRDQHLKCLCKGGVIAVQTETTHNILGKSIKSTETFCDRCQLGRDLQKKKSLTFLVMLMALITGRKVS